MKCDHIYTYIATKVTLKDMLNALWKVTTQVGRWWPPKKRFSISNKQPICHRASVIVRLMLALT
jgi:hypothetical protein